MATHTHTHTHTHSRTHAHAHARTRLTSATIPTRPLAATLAHTDPAPNLTTVGFLAEADPVFERTPLAPGGPTPQVGGLAGPLERGDPGAKSPTFKRPAKWKETQGGAAGQERVQEDLCLFGPPGRGEGGLAIRAEGSKGVSEGAARERASLGPG